MDFNTDHIDLMFDRIAKGLPPTYDPGLIRLAQQVVDHMEYLRENPLTEDQIRENRRRWAEWSASFDD